MAKRTTKKYDLESGMLTIAFVNGAEDFDIDSLPEDMKRRLMFHGASQLLGDSYAGENDEYAYKGHALKRYENLTKSDWSTRGTDSGLEDKLEAAKYCIMEYDNLDEEGKRAVAKLGVNRQALVKEVTQLEKRIAKRDEKN